MTKVYPITVLKDAEFYVVYIPDFDMNTQGLSLSDALFMAKDAIGLMGITLEDEGKAIPEPSELSAIKPENENEVVALVDIDFAEYRRKNDQRTVRRNVTLPAWLDAEAKKAKINVSAVLQRALKSELNISAM